MDSAARPVQIHKTTLRIAVGSLFFLAGLCFAQSCICATQPEAVFDSRAAVGRCRSRRALTST